MKLENYFISVNFSAFITTYLFSDLVKVLLSDWEPQISFPYYFYNILSDQIVHFEGVGTYVKFENSGVFGLYLGYFTLYQRNNSLS